MAKKTGKRKGSSKAGRPRKEGERKPCGRLVQRVEPNAKVVELRQAMLNGTRATLASAENPMDLALVRGWITEDQHRAGTTFAAAWRRSHPQRSTTGSLPETPNRDYDPRPISQMGSAEIVEAFESILAGTHRMSDDASQANARKRYNEMCLKMRPEEQNEVFLCFCMESWPQWVIQRVAGHFETPWERKRGYLVSGLSQITQYLAPTRKSA